MGMQRRSFRSHSRRATLYALKLDISKGIFPIQVLRRKLEGICFWRRITELIVYSRLRRSRSLRGMHSSMQSYSSYMCFLDPVICVLSSGDKCWCCCCRCRRLAAPRFAYFAIGPKARDEMLQVKEVSSAAREQQINKHGRCSTATCLRGISRYDISSFSHRSVWHLTELLVPLGPPSRGGST